jgi:hypothetical protein
LAAQTLAEPLGQRPSFGNPSERPDFFTPSEAIFPVSVPEVRTRKGHPSTVVLEPVSGFIPAKNYPS